MVPKNAPKQQTVFPLQTFLSDVGVQEGGMHETNAAAQHIWPGGRCDLWRMVRLGCAFAD